MAASTQPSRHFETRNLAARAQDAIVESLRVASTRFSTSRVDSLGNGNQTVTGAIDVSVQITAGTAAMKPLDRRFNCTMTLFRASAACIAALAGVRGVAVNAQDRLDGARPSMDEIMVTGTRRRSLRTQARAASGTKPPHRF